MSELLRTRWIDVTIGQIIGVFLAFVLVFVIIAAAQSLAAARRQRRDNAARIHPGHRTDRTRP